MMLHTFIPNTGEMEAVRLQLGKQPSYTARPVSTAAAATTHIYEEANGYDKHHGPTQEAKAAREQDFEEAWAI